MGHAAKLPAYFKRLAIAFSCVAAVGITVPAYADDQSFILPFYGYGTPTQFELSGRVLEGMPNAAPRKGDGYFTNLARAWTELETDEIEGACVRGNVFGVAVRSTTDADGVWKLSFKPARGAARIGTHKVTVFPCSGSAPAPATASVFLIPDGPAVAVVSDFDDTIAESGVTNKAVLAANTVFKNAAQLPPVRGAAGAYNAALKAGAAATFYLSGSPHNLFARLATFLEINKLPAGPLLLKNFGEDELLGQAEYKSRQVESLLTRFPKLRLVCVGDSGQQDAQIYADLSAKHPGRIVGIVIRHVPDTNVDFSTLGTSVTLVEDYASDPNVIAEHVRKALQNSP